MRVRMLCGAYDLSSPFIEGGCANEWIDYLDEPACSISCPSCNQTCIPELADCARIMLQKRVVFVYGCPHKAFTFSRRDKKPYFAPEETAEELRETGEP